jgi:hypothetical protein
MMKRRLWKRKILNLILNQKLNGVNGLYILTVENFRVTRPLNVMAAADVPIQSSQNKKNVLMDGKLHSIGN